jgi:hypothetical protein
MPAGIVTVDISCPTEASDERSTTTGTALASSSVTVLPLASTALSVLIVTQTFEYSVARLSVM